MLSAASCWNLSHLLPCFLWHINDISTRPCCLKNIYFTPNPSNIQLTVTLKAVKVRLVCNNTLNCVKLGAKLAKNAWIWCRNERFEAEVWVLGSSRVLPPTRPPFLSLCLVDPSRLASTRRPEFGLFPPISALRSAAVVRSGAES